jgi:hypothetical protein
MGGTAVEKRWPTFSIVASCNHHTMRIRRAEREILYNYTNRSYAFMTALEQRVDEEIHRELAEVGVGHDRLQSQF